MKYVFNSGYGKSAILISTIDAINGLYRFKIPKVDSKSQFTDGIFTHNTKFVILVNNKKPDERAARGTFIIDGSNQIITLDDHYEITVNITLTTLESIFDINDFSFIYFITSAGSSTQTLVELQDTDINDTTPLVHGHGLVYDSGSQTWINQDLAGVGSGESNTASNQGGFIQPFIQKTVDDLEFRTLQSTKGLTITQNAQDIDIKVELSGTAVKWIFNNTVDGTPNNGQFTLQTASISTATHFKANKTDSTNNFVELLWTSTHFNVGENIFIRDTVNAGLYTHYEITSITANASWFTIGVTNIGGSLAGFTNGDEYLFYHAPTNNPHTLGSHTNVDPAVDTLVGSYDPYLRWDWKNDQWRSDGVRWTDVEEKPRLQGHPFKFEQSVGPPVSGGVFKISGGTIQITQADSEGGDISQLSSLFTTAGTTFRWFNTHPGFPIGIVYGRLGGLTPVPLGTPPYWSGPISFISTIDVPPISTSDLAGMMYLQPPAATSSVTGHPYRYGSAVAVGSGEIFYNGGTNPPTISISKTDANGVSLINGLGGHITAPQAIGKWYSNSSANHIYYKNIHLPELSDAGTYWTGDVEFFGGIPATTGELGYLLPQPQHLLLNSVVDRQYLMYDSSNAAFVNQTFSMGSIYWRNNATSTTISTQKTVLTDNSNFVKVLGTSILKHNVEFDMPVSGRLRFTGSKTKMFHIMASFSATAASNNREFYFTLVKNGTTYDDVILQNSLHGDRSQGNALHTDVELNTDDYLELYCANTSNTDNANITFMYMFAMGV